MQNILFILIILGLATVIFLLLRKKEEKPETHRLYQEIDRQEAINLAIKLAEPGDCVGLLGKSHEKSMCFGTIEYPWDEFKAVSKALKLRSQK